MNTVAIIPARGGSKRLPHKNITPILGKPLIAWSIDAAIQSSFIGPENVYVSTEDSQVADIARQYGAQIVNRPPELALDHVWTEPVMRHAVEALEQQGKPIDQVVWLNPCGAQVTSADINHALKRLARENLREIISVDGKLRSNSIVRAMRRETLSQRALSVHCGVMILDYVDIHYAADVARVEDILRARAAKSKGVDFAANMILDDSKWSHKAWMSQIDAELLERIVTHQAYAAARSFDALEWGSGKSTLYFTARLEQLAIPSTWLSIEYDRAFFHRELEAQFRARPNTRIILINGTGQTETHLTDKGESCVELTVVVFDKGQVQPFLSDHVADRFVDMDDYVAYPETLGRSFDFVLVDGRKRRRCVIAAAALLKERGIAVLHDAYREHYQCAFSGYASQRMVGEILWVGSQARTNFLEWIV
ncbi:MAG: hypothetical protein DCC52_00020 [Chloroflexi bacterium]|nr:MAG: hypothetical protein DCC52_00020 [Chloroflexota bacterium]